MRKYRFFYHYRRHGEKKMSVHFRGKCYNVDNVVCNVPSETKHNRIQPLLVVQGKTAIIKRTRNLITIG